MKLAGNMAVIACCAALVAALPGTSVLAKSKPSKGVVASVTGGGDVLLTAGHLGPFPGSTAGSRLHLSLTARTLPNGKACTTKHKCGQFEIVQHKPKGGNFARLKGQVNCSHFAGKVANVTGIVKTGSTKPKSTVVKGTTVAITVADDQGPKGADLIGLDFSFLGHTIGPCASGGPTANLVVSAGNFTVHTKKA